MNEWRERLLNSILLVGVALGTIAYVPSLWISVSLQFWGVALIDSVALFWGFLIFFWRRPPYIVRAASFLGIMYMLGTCLLIYVGPISQIYLFAFSILGGLLLGTRAAVATIIINAITLLGVGYTTKAAFTTQFGDLEQSLVGWVVITINFLFVNTVLCISLTVVLNRLENALMQAGDATNALKQEHIRILDINWQMEGEINQRIKAEDELSRLVLAVQQASDGILIVDDSIDYCYANPSFCNLFGLAPAPHEIRALKELHFALDDDSEAFTVWDFLTDARDRPIRMQLQRVDGTRLKVEVSRATLRSEFEAVKASVIVVRDMTERIELEQRLLRTQRLEATGTLAAGIAHDFNNILLSILGNAELLKEDIGENQEAGASIDEILRASARARALIRQILTFTRQMEVARKPLELQEHVSETLNLLRAAMPTSIDLQVRIDNCHAVVFADPSELHQIVMNICTNAYQAMEHDAGLLTITLECLQPGAPETVRIANLNPELHYARLSIRDTGCGMEAKTIARVFDPFFTTKSVGKGSGLGLAIVHGVVTSLGGGIMIDSEMGKGTLVNIYLPILDNEPVQHVASPAEDSHSGGKQERILLVDDEESLLLLTSRHLQRLGYKPTPFVNSAEALDAFVANPHSYDLVITDQTMPILKGTQLVIEMRRIRPDLPIILSSGFDESLTHDSIEELGVSSFLYKPYRQRDLAVAVREALDKRV